MVVIFKTINSVTAETPTQPFTFSSTGQLSGLYSPSCIKCNEQIETLMVDNVQDDGIPIPPRCDLLVPDMRIIVRCKNGVIALVVKVPVSLEIPTTPTFYSTSSNYTAEKLGNVTDGLSTSFVDALLQTGAPSTTTKSYYKPILQNRVIVKLPESISPTIILPLTNSQLFAAKFKRLIFWELPKSLKGTSSASSDLDNNQRYRKSINLHYIRDHHNKLISTLTKIYAETSLPGSGGWSSTGDVPGALLLSYSGGNSLRSRFKKSDRFMFTILDSISGPIRIDTKHNSGWVVGGGEKKISNDRQSNTNNIRTLSRADSIRQLFEKTVDGYKYKTMTIGEVLPNLLRDVVSKTTIPNQACDDSKMEDRYNSVDYWIENVLPKYISLFESSDSNLSTSTAYSSSRVLPSSINEGRGIVGDGFNIEVVVINDDGILSL